MSVDDSVIGIYVYTRLKEKLCVIGETISYNARSAGLGNSARPGISLSTS